MATPPFGTIVFSGDGSDGPLQFFDPSGVPVTPPASNPEAGNGVRGIVSLASGKVCVCGGFPIVPDSVPPGATGAGIFAVDFLSSVEATTPSLGNLNSQLSRDDNGFFYGRTNGAPGSDNRIAKYNEAGTRVAVWNPAAGTIIAVAVNGAGTIAYYVLSSSPTAIRAWDLVGDTSLGIFSTEVGVTAASSFDYWMLMSNTAGDVFALWNIPGATPAIVRRRDSAGAFVQDYTLDGSNGFILSIARGLTSETFVTLHYGDATTYSGVTFTEFNIETGAVVSTFDPEDGSFDYSGPLTVLGEEAPTPPVPPTPATEDLAASTEDPVIFCSLAPLDVERQWYAVTQLPDAADYYGGWKEDRLLELSDVRRSLSGPGLDYQVGSFQVLLADEDYAIRSLLELSPYYSTWELEAYIVSPSGRLAEVEALKLATGIVDSDPEFDSANVAMSVRFTCRDRIGIAMGWTSTGQSKVPRRVLNQTTLPGVVSSLQGKGAPVPLGLLSNAIAIPSGFGPPVPSGILAYGATFDSPYWTGGWAPWTASVAAVTGLALGTSAGGACPERDFAIQIFPVGADGNVGDPTPYVAGAVTTTVTSPDLTIDASWVASPDAVKYYAVLFAYYFGWRAQQILETTGTSVSFDAAYDTPNPGTGLATGAVDVPDTPFYYYAARSKEASVRSAWSDAGSITAEGSIQASSITLPNGKTRPVRVWFTPAVSAESYEIRKSAAGPSEPLIFPLLASQLQAGALYFDDDYTNTGGITSQQITDRPGGRVKGLYSRDVTLSAGGDTWKEFLVAGIAIQGIDDWYYDPGGDVSNVEINEDDGTAFLFPKSGSAWDAVFTTPYRDIVGADGVTRRYTVGYAKGAKGQHLASGQASISFNLRGAETLGDGSGDLLTDYHDQFQYVLNRHILASGEGYTTGLYGPVPTQGLELLPVVDADSFDEVKAMREAELAGGLVGAGVMGALGELVDVATEIQRWCEGGDVRLGPSRLWQIKAAAINVNLSPLFISSDLSDEFDFHNRTFKPAPRMAELENVFQYEYRRDYVEGGFSVANQSFRNQDSIDRWRLIKPGGTLSFHYLEDDAAVALILSRHVSRRAAPLMYVQAEVGLKGMGAEYDIGEYYTLRHWRGVANGGWTDRVMWILAHAFLPTSKRVRLECLDVTDLLGDAQTNALLEEQMDIELGGSWYNSPEVAASPVIVDAFEYWDKRVPWASLPTGTTVTARVWGAVPSGVSMVAEIYDPDNAVVVATDPTPFTSASITLHTFQLPAATVDKQYRLRATVTGGSGQTVALKGLLRTTLP